MAPRIQLAGVLVDAGGHLGVDRLRQHLPSPLSKDFLEKVVRGRAWTWVDFVRSVAHVAYLPLRGFLVGLDNHQGTPRSHIVIHDIRSYLCGACLRRICQLRSLASDTG